MVKKILKEPAAYKYQRPPLIVDNEYRNASNNWRNPKDDFNKMFKREESETGMRNGGGFRWKKKIGFEAKGTKSILGAGFVILYTDAVQPEWPDHLDMESGIFTYYGDRRTPGALRETQNGGNQFLEKTFADLHTEKRGEVVPVLLFRGLKKGNKTFIKFLGLAAPGAKSWTRGEDLVSVFRSMKGQRFENFKSVFTVLATTEISWLWVDDLVRGVAPVESKYCPPQWKRFVKSGQYDALEVRSADSARTKNEQLPDKEDGYILKKLNKITDREFEYVTKNLVQLLNPGFTRLVVTPRAGDKARDVDGVLVLGEGSAKVELPLIAEAKQWKGGVGPGAMKRLVSQMRDKTVGVFVTTSYYTNQVFTELKMNRWPVILVAGGDICKILKRHGLANIKDPEVLEKWIQDAVDENKGLTTETKK